MTTRTIPITAPPSPLPALKALRALVRLWTDDRACGCVPTSESMAAGMALLDGAIEQQEGR
jgi:hypothetical protein